MKSKLKKFLETNEKKSEGMKKVWQERKMGEKQKYKVVDEQGNTLGTFKLRVTASQALGKLKLNKREKLRVELI